MHACVVGEFLGPAGASSRRRVNCPEATKAVQGRPFTMTHVTIHRLPIIQVSPRGVVRRLSVSVENDCGRVTRYFPGIENGDDPDKVPAGDHELVMATMATKGYRALWLQGTELFGHPANWPDQLHGCWAIGQELWTNGVGRSSNAFNSLWEALGGFEEGRKVPVTVVEYATR